MNRSPLNPLIVIPTYNTGWRLRETVRAALNYNLPVWVVVDGSTDGSEAALQDLAGDANFFRLRILQLNKNSGKGAAVLHAAELAEAADFTHMLTMDADGQHPSDCIDEFIRQGQLHPQAIIMGLPKFGPDVPRARLHGRKLTNFWTSLETLWCGLGDTLFGMRLYPLKAFVQAMRQTPFARGFDFDPEVAVRMCWLGCRPVQVPTPVRYHTKDEGGVSHFNYVRDNIKLTLLHFRLVAEFLLWRLWWFLPFRLKWNIIKP